MSKVQLTYRVMPDGIDVDLDAVAKAAEAALPDGASLEATDTKPFAFGLKALLLRIVVGDEAGRADAVEEALRAVKGVQGVELAEMGRLL